ncbi:plasmid recombination protein [Pseudomonas monteilii]|uniref:plasmid recombination protein n=1 Tax=Pseudomonas monteilii TaxID=76759 RepID=UPI0018A485DA|nr:plasmid recombination protein [Pseudomonas monteilii]BBW00103.1 hypothetical protein STW0522PSE72_P40010 [Pseudomonas monteilii]
MSFQFLHVNSYSRQLSGKASHSKWVAKDVVAEATRDPGAIPHVKNPVEPTLIYGKPMSALLDTLDAWAEGTRDARGRATRKDAVCLLAGVFSMPDGTAPEAWEKYKADNVEYLQNKYGDRLETVIEHTDEEHPHCHFYVVPLPGENFETVHEGRRAVKEFVAQGGDKKKSNDVYRAAMRLVQDEYYEQVGAKNGMARVGPGKRRLSRAEWHAEQQQARAIQQQYERADALVANAQGIEADAVEHRAEAAANAEQIKADARAEAKRVAAQALENADKIEAEAVKIGRRRGWQEAMDAFEALPWFQRAKNVIGRAVKQRDQLQEQVQKLSAERVSLRKKLQDFFRAGTAYRDELKQVKPQLTAMQDELAKVRKRADQAEQLQAKNENLQDSLEGAKGYIQHLEATVEALQPKAPEKPAAKRQEAAPGASLDA